MIIISHVFKNKTRFKYKNLGQGPYGPGNIWARAHMGQGPYGPRAHGPRALPCWANTSPKNASWKKESKLCFFVYFVGNKKDARRPYDHFGGGIAPRSLLRAKKQRFLFWAKTLILDLSGDRNNKYIRAVYIFLWYIFYLCVSRNEFDGSCDALLKVGWGF